MYSYLSEIKNLVENKAWIKVLFYFFENDFNYNKALDTCKLTYDSVINTIDKEISEIKSLEDKKEQLKCITKLLITNITKNKTNIAKSKLEHFHKQLFNKSDTEYCKFKIKIYANNPGINLDLIRLMEGVSKKADATDILLAHCESDFLNLELMVYLILNGADLNKKIKFFSSEKISDLLKVKNIKFIYEPNLLKGKFTLHQEVFSNKLNGGCFYFDKINQFIMPFDKNSQTELHRLCANSSEKPVNMNVVRSKIVKSNLEHLLTHLEKFKDIDINSQDTDGNTALHLYLMGSNLTYTAVKLLVENGASLDKKNKSNEVPFDCLRNNIKATDEFLRDWLFHSIEQYDIEQIKLLLELAKEKNLDILNKYNFDGLVSLHYSWKKWEEGSFVKAFNLIKILLTAGADPNIPKTNLLELLDRKCLETTVVEDKEKIFQIAIHLLAYGANFTGNFKKNSDINMLTSYCNRLKFYKRINDFTDLVQYIPIETSALMKDKFLERMTNSQKQCLFSFFACCKIKNFKIPKPLKFQIAFESLGIQVLSIELKRDLLLSFFKKESQFVLDWLCDIIQLPYEEGLSLKFTK